MKNGSRRPAGPRDLLDVRRADPIDLDEVEPVEAITRRFISSAMSLGALSPEAHATLSVAMNRMGARSNSGEGGEDPRHYHGFENGDRADNRIKQVASARFGVTTEYLTRAEELEIKIVQGAKPGEGGQLPAHKVTELIARLRHAVPGIQLISPPPHHDIYSIEDLAQLIHDLKTVNPRARVGREAGVRSRCGHGGRRGGQGVRRLRADRGTQRWHRRVAAQLDQACRLAVGARAGGGADDAACATASATGSRCAPTAVSRPDATWSSPRCSAPRAIGFGTAPLVAMGCAMARQCHINTCPTGIATQREDLRAKFKGTPEQVIGYFSLLAGEVREILAAMGVRSIDEIVGRSDLLERVERPDVPRAQMLDLSVLMTPADSSPRSGQTALRRTEARNDRPGVASLDSEVLNDLGPYLDSGLPFSGTYPIYNHHLTVGARVAGAIVERHGDAGLPPARCVSASPARRGRASAPSPAAACISSWRARPTTTWARD